MEFNRIETKRKRKKKEEGGINPSNIRPRSAKGKVFPQKGKE